MTLARKRAAPQYLPATDCGSKKIPVGLLQSSLLEQPFKKHRQVLMALRSLIIQAHLLLFREQLPAVSDLVGGFVGLNPTCSSIMPAKDHADACHEYREAIETQ